MTGISKFMMCVFGMLSLVAAQEKVQVKRFAFCIIVWNLYLLDIYDPCSQVTVPIEGGGKYDISFDLVQVGDIANAAREFCVQKAGELGITTQEQLTTVCVPRVEEFMIASLLANKALDKQAPSNSVSVSLLVCFHILSLSLVLFFVFYNR